MALDISRVQGEIRRALSMKGITAARASRMASGNPSLIKNILNGHVPRLDSLARVAECLDIDFYFGPPRNSPPVHPTSLLHAEAAPSELAIQSAKTSIDDADSTTALEELRAEVAALHEDLGLRASLEPPAEAARPLVTLQEHKVPPFAWSARTAAGSGDPVFGELTEPRYAFHKSIIPDWVRSESLLCIEVVGDSMQPTIHDGDILLLDRSQIEPLSGQIFILHTPDGLIVKRLRRTGRKWMLISDNPAYEPRPVGREDRIVGRVAWAGAAP